MALVEIGSGRTGSGRSGSGTIGSGRSGSGRTGSGTIDSVTLTELALAQLTLADLALCHVTTLADKKRFCFGILSKFSACGELAGIGSDTIDSGYVM